MMMKRGVVDKQGESMVASYRYLGVSNPVLQMIESNECDVSCLHGTRASFQYIRRFLHFIILRPKKPLGLRIIECKHQTFSIEKFRDFIVTSQSCPRGKKIFLKKIL